MGKNLIIKGADFSACGLGNAFNYLNNQGDLTGYSDVSDNGVSPFALKDVSRIVGKKITALQINFQATGVFTVGKVSGFKTTNVFSQEQKYVISRTGVQIISLRNPITIESSTDNIFFSAKDDTAKYYYGTNSDAEIKGFYSSTSGQLFNAETSRNLAINLIGE